MNRLVASANARMGLVALLVLVLDQFTKLLMLRKLDFNEEWVLVDGFFKFVLWGNTGAAWSLFHGQNKWLAVVSLGALLVLYLARKHFDFHRLGGQIALGLMIGGIAGNLIDRIRFGQVIDFIYFYLIQRNGNEVGFPAFNIADSAICSGVGLLLVLSWMGESRERESAAPAAPS